MAIVQDDKLISKISSSITNLHAILKNLHDTVLAVDHEGTILFINHSGNQLSTDNLIGTSLYDYIPSDDIPVI